MSAWLLNLEDTGSTVATPDSLAVDVVQDEPWAAQDDTTAFPDGIAVTLTLDAPAAGEVNYADPDGDITLTVVSDPPATSFSMTAAPVGLSLPITITGPTGTFAATASPTDLAVAVTLGTGPSVRRSIPVAEGPALPIVQDEPSITVHFTVTPDGIGVPVTPGEPGRTSWPPKPVIPIVAPAPYAVPALPVHLMGIGPWNNTVSWGGCANYGIAKGVRQSRPALNLPMAESKSVTLRLNDASEARTTHYFARHEVISIQENITDLWWRRRDPRRGVVDRIGRFNANVVDTEIQPDGGILVSATYVDYYGLLADRINMKYLTPGANPPTTLWAKNTLVTEILRFGIPTNMGLDLTGIDADTPDITAKITVPFHMELGTPVESMMKILQQLSDKAWEWWIDTPPYDGARPRLTLGTRGRDRGEILFDVGAAGPITTWNVQRAGDRYANALYFKGADGGAVMDLPDEIAVYGQRDASFDDSTVSGKKDANGQPSILRSATEAKLAEMSAHLPSYQITLRQGFWEGRTHIDIGDWLGLRLEMGDEILSGKHRVVEIGVDIDSTGLETVTLTLGAARPSKDPRSRTSSTARLVRYLRNYTVLDGFPNYNF